MPRPRICSCYYLQCHCMNVPRSLQHPTILLHLDDIYTLVPKGPRYKTYSKYNAHAPNPLHSSLLSELLPMFPMDISNVLTFLILALAAYTIYGILYRLYFSPVAGFPGPRLAALSFWYEFYYDVVKRGQYTFKIRELHERYGTLSINSQKMLVCLQFVACTINARNMTGEIDDNSTA